MQSRQVPRQRVASEEGVERLQRQRELEFGTRRGQASMAWQPNPPPRNKEAANGRTWFDASASMHNWLAKCRTARVLERM